MLICPPAGTLPQLEVDGRVTTKQLDNLISQTEYALAVTPVYDEGPAEPMLGEAITGRRRSSYITTTTTKQNDISWKCMSASIPHLSPPPLHTLER